MWSSPGPAWAVGFRAGRAGLHAVGAERLRATHAPLGRGRRCAMSGRSAGRCGAVAGPRPPPGRGGRVPGAGSRAVHTARRVWARGPGGPRAPSGSAAAGPGRPGLHEGIEDRVGQVGCGVESALVVGGAGRARPAAALRRRRGARRARAGRVRPLRPLTGAGWGRTGQDRTGQDRTGQDRTGAPWVRRGRVSPRPGVAVRCRPDVSDGCAQGVRPACR
jgi:hypothetical protein